MKSLAVLALASMASATYFNAELLRREIVHVVVEVRQATEAPTASGAASGAAPVVPSAPAASADACSSALAGLASLVTGLPVPTGELSSYLATAATTLTNPCSLSVPSSIASDFSVYETSVISFFDAHSSQLSSALSACPSLTSLVQNPVCSTSAGGGSAGGGSAGGGSAGGGSAEGSSASGGSAEGSSTSASTTEAATGAATGSAGGSATATQSSPAPVSTAGANSGQETQGLMAAVIAVAGVVGAVVAL